MKINVKKLNLYQAEKCLTNKELKEESGVGLLTITMIKNGKRNANPKTVGKIAKALGINVSDLLE